MQRIAENIRQIESELPQSTQLVVVSKYREIHEIQAAYDAGQRIFAENRVQALLERVEALPQDIEWHLIGHLQSNKVKYIAPFIAMIHSVDSLELLKEINKQAAKHHRVIRCLVQLHVAQEESKFGLAISELPNFFEGWKSGEFAHVQLVGLMAMASLTEDESQISKEFALVQQSFNEVKQTYFPSDDHFNEISIGMSSDYKIAIEHGSTMVRIGSAVFA